MSEQARHDPKLGLYRLVFESAADPTLILDAEGDVVLANHAARTQASELVAQLREQTGPYAVELARFRAELEGTGRSRIELNVDGRTIAMDGRAHGAQYIVVLRDVSERRRLEAQLMALTFRGAFAGSSEGPAR